MKHATVRLGDYNIPLIGIAKSSTEEECDLCGDIFHISTVEFTGKQFLCGKCRKESPSTTNQRTNQ